MPSALTALRSVVRPSFTQVSTGAVGSFYPIGLSADRTRLYLGGGLLGTQHTLAESTDQGATKTDLHTFGEIVDGVIETADGEALVATKSSFDYIGRIYKSNGWATNRATATWTEVLDTPAGAAPTTRYFRTAWGFNQKCLGANGDIYVTPYGYQTGSGSDPSTKLWRSTDHGATWSVVLDISTRYAGVTPLHLHAVAYDPYFDRVWVTFGDQVYPDDGATAGYTLALILYSDDRGATWTRLPMIDLKPAPAAQTPAAGTFRAQATSIAVFPGCVLFGSDDVPAGLLRLTRTGYRTVGNLHAVPVSSAAANDLLPQDFYQGAPGLPCVMTMLSASGTMAKLLVTRDGFDLYEAYAETKASGAPSSFGFFHGPYGPDTSGLFVGVTNNLGASAQNRVVLSLDWEPIEAPVAGYPVGLPGATSPTRYVGATASGAPSTGTFAVGDFVISQVGSVWVCITAGSPGTWTKYVSSGDQGYSTGFYVPPQGINQAAATPLTASRAYIARFVAPKTMTITKIAFQLTNAAGSNDNCDVGIFDASLTTLLGSSGSTAGKLNAAPGPQTVNLTGSVPLVAGTVYYAAFAMGTIGTTAAQIAFTTGSIAAPVLFGATAGNIAQAVQSSAFPLAAPFTPSASQSSCVILALIQ